MTGEESRLISRAALADRLHWTLEYIDGMDPLERVELIHILSGLDAAQAWRAKVG